jgi:hypothetical protein
LGFFQRKGNCPDRAKNNTTPESISGFMSSKIASILSWRDYQQSQTSDPKIDAQHASF